MSISLPTWSLTYTSPLAPAEMAEMLANTASRDCSLFPFLAPPQSQSLSRQLHFESLPAKTEILPSVPILLTRLTLRESLSALKSAPVDEKAMPCGLTSVVCEARLFR